MLKASNASTSPWLLSLTHFRFSAPSVVNYTPPAYREQQTAIKVAGIRGGKEAFRKGDEIPEDFRKRGR